MASITIRLDKKQEKQLAKLQERFGEKTASKVFLAVFERHEPLSDELDKCREELRVMSYELRSLKNRVSNFKESFDDLFKD